MATDERKPILSRLPADLLDRLATRCDELGMVRNTAIQRALEAWLGEGERTPLDTAIIAVTPHTTPPTPKRMTIDDVRPAFAPRLKPRK